MVCVAQSVKEILEDDAIHLRSDMSDFWIVAAALKRFLDDYGVLPLNGSIPDMTATTESPPSRIQKSSACV